MTAADWLKLLLLLDSMSAQALDAYNKIKTDLASNDETALKDELKKTRMKTDELYAEVMKDLGA